MFSSNLLFMMYHPTHLGESHIYEKKDFSGFSFLCHQTVLFAALCSLFSHLQSLPEFQAQVAQQAQQTRGSGGPQGRGSSSGGSSSRSSSQSHVVKVFSKYDVPETSYHFYSERIDLHFCDDPGRKY